MAQQAKTQILLTQYERVKLTEEEIQIYDLVMPQAEAQAQAYAAQIMNILSESAEPWQMMECILTDILRDKYFSELVRNYMLIKK